MTVTDETRAAMVKAISAQISEGTGAILRKFCDSQNAARARENLHNMPPNDWYTFVTMLADASADAAIAVLEQNKDRT